MKRTQTESDFFANPSGRAFGGILTACFLAVFLLAPSAFAEVPDGEDEKTIYFIGVILSKQAPFSTLSPEEVNLVAQGLQDSLSGVDTQLDPAEYGAKVQSLTESRMSMLLDNEKSEGIKYADSMGKKEGAEKTPSGLILISEEDGTGASPSSTDTVKVHYHGTLRDGTVFDSSLERGEPVEFALNRVIPCWTEGVAKMKAGGKATLICPPEIAYGDRGAPPMIPGGATLTFVVDLIEVKPSP